MKEGCQQQNKREKTTKHDFYITCPTVCIISIPVDAMGLIEGFIKRRDVRQQGLVTGSPIAGHLVGREVGAGVDPVIPLLGTDVILVRHGNHLVVRRDRTSVSQQKSESDDCVVFVSYSVRVFPLAEEKS